jgi:hypothetical protein
MPVQICRGFSDEQWRTIRLRLDKGDESAWPCAVEIFERRIPRWTAQIPPLIDSSKPAISDGRPRLVEFYFVASSGRKSVWTLVRQLRGPHLST